MKNAFILIIFFSFLLSCKTVDTLIEHESYDQAFELQLDNMTKNRDYNFEQVTQLEKLFQLSSSKDLAKLNGLRRRENDTYKWDKIYNLGKFIEWRQNEISALLPIVANDGYEAQFVFIDTDEILVNAAAESSSIFHLEIERLLRKAEENSDKDAARKAYDLIKRLARYNQYFTALNDYKVKAQNLGKEHVLIELDASVFERLPDYYINMAILNIEAEEQSWMTFHVLPDSNLHYDQRLKLSIEDINLGIGSVREYNRVLPLYNKNPRRPSQVDSTRTPQPRVNFTTQVIKETVDQRIAILKGKIELIDLKSDHVLKKKKVNLMRNYSSSNISHDVNTRGIILRNANNPGARIHQRNKVDIPHESLILEGLMEDLSQQINSFIGSLEKQYAID